MTKSNKTKADLVAENRVLRRIDSANGWASVLRTAIKWGGMVGVARYAWLAVDSLAGQSTVADIGLKFLAEVGVSDVLAWLLAGGAVVFGLVQKKLRGDTIQRLSGRIQQLEQQIDPRRTSSHLTVRGQTNPVDRE